LVRISQNNNAIIEHLSFHNSLIANQRTLELRSNRKRNGPHLALQLASIVTSIAKIFAFGVKSNLSSLYSVNSDQVLELLRYTVCRKQYPCKINEEQLTIQRPL
jgi:hypothetical protein